MFGSWGRAAIHMEGRWRDYFLPRRGNRHGLCKQVGFTSGRRSDNIFALPIALGDRFITTRWHLRLARNSSADFENGDFATSPYFDQRGWTALQYFLSAICRRFVLSSR